MFRPASSFLGAAVLSVLVTLTCHVRCAASVQAPRKADLHSESEVRVDEITYRNVMRLTRYSNAMLTSERKHPDQALDQPYTVVFVFAGREDRMHLLMNYLKGMLSNGKVNEVHVWDRTRTQHDADWLRTFDDDTAVVLGAGGGRADRWKQNWEEVYRYYSPEGEFIPVGNNVTPEGTVIIKMDDDIVYLDEQKLPAFVSYVHTHPSMFLVFPNIVNNGVTAYYQGHHIPQLAKEVPDIIEYPENGNGGALLKRGDLEKKLHSYFLAHMDQFSWDDRENGNCIVFQAPQTNFPSQGRFSINAFGVRQEAFELVWALVQGRRDDERLLSEEATRNNLTECIFTPFVVAHLGFRHSAPTEVLPDYEALWESLSRE